MNYLESYNRLLNVIRSRCWVGGGGGGGGGGGRGRGTEAGNAHFVAGHGQAQ